jgi:hypothetical protein
LRRFVLIDDTPRNTESCALGKLAFEMRELGYGRILAYADPKQGHAGVIYKAAGYDFWGTTSARKHLRCAKTISAPLEHLRGKLLPDRNLHQTKFPYHVEVRAALARGEISLERIPGKNIYVKELNPRTVF